MMHHWQTPQGEILEAKTFGALIAKYFYSHLLAKFLSAFSKKSAQPAGSTSAVIDMAGCVDKHTRPEFATAEAAGQPGTGEVYCPETPGETNSNWIRRET